MVRTTAIQRQNEKTTWTSRHAIVSQRPSETHGEDEDFLEIIRMTRDCPRSSGDRLEMTLRYSGLKVL